MSRVTIKELYWELYDKDNSVWRQCNNIEIVPRKMVEIIIDKCNDEMEYCDKFEGNEYYDGKFDGVGFIKNIAKMLLKEFDDDGKKI